MSILWCASMDAHECHSERSIARVVHRWAALNAASSSTCRKWDKSCDGAPTLMGRYAKFDPPRGTTLWTRHRDHSPLANHTWVEISHCASTFGRRAACGVLANWPCPPWFYVTRGSGVYLNIGRTLVAWSHEDAAAHLTGKAEWCGTCTTLLNLLTFRARAMGYDTLQIVGHSDQTCGNMAIELVDVRAEGLAELAVCGGGHAQGGTSGGVVLRSGWRASEPCICVESRASHEPHTTPSP